MSTMTIAAVALAGGFTLYPPPQATKPRIEAITDKGPILEMIVRCPVGSAIISYSKVERLFCGPRLTCGPDRATIVRHACR